MCTHKAKDVKIKKRKSCKDTGRRILEEQGSKEGYRKKSRSPVSLAGKVSSFVSCTFYFSTAVITQGPIYLKKGLPQTKD